MKMGPEMAQWVIESFENIGLGQCINTDPTLTTKAHGGASMAVDDPTAVTLYTRKGQPFIVDGSDVFAVTFYSWRRMLPFGYLRTRVGKEIQRDGKLVQDCGSIALHQFIMGFAPDGFQWDHINRDKMDNRRCNLRVVTPTENNRNVGMCKNNTSGYKGVSHIRGTKKWRATIGVNGRVYEIGSFDSAEEAASARRDAEIECWEGGKPVHTFLAARREQRRDR